MDLKLGIDDTTRKEDLSLRDEIVKAISRLCVRFI
jgi:hypothetical protein